MFTSLVVIFLDYSVPFIAMSKLLSASPPLRVKLEIPGGLELSVILFINVALLENVSLADVLLFAVLLFSSTTSSTT